jgi:hypothetical protein
MIRSQVVRPAPASGSAVDSQVRGRSPADPGLVLVLLGTLGAFFGQWLAGNGGRGEWVLVVYASAAVTFLAGVATTADGPLAVPAVPAVAGGAPATWPGVRWPLAAGALVMALVTFVSSGTGGQAALGPREIGLLCQGDRVLLSNQLTPLNVTSWALTIALALASVWHRDPVSQGVSPGGRRWWTPFVGGSASASGPGDGGGEATLRLPWTTVALGAILLFGVGMLYFRIADVPAEMTSDHAEKLLDVQTILDGRRPVFFPCNTGREAMQFYLIAAMTPLTGLTYLTMKLGTAGVAALALPFTFLFARTLFGARLALLATLVLATTRWLWQVARVGLRFPFPPAFGAAIFFFLVRALRYRRRNDFLLCGLTLGLAQHSYTALRFAPLAVLGCVAVALAADVRAQAPPARRRALATDTVLLFAIAGVATLPLIRYAFDQPYAFLFRGASRVASDTLAGPPSDLWLIFLDNVKNAFLMFNWRGDLVWVNTIPGEPILDPISGALFVLGVAYGVYRLIRYRELPYLYLFVLLFVGLLPSILSLAYPGENPSAVRTGMAIPVVAVLVALPLFVLARRLTAWVGGRSRPVAAGLVLGALLVPIFRVNTDQYFRVYARQHSQSSQHSAQVAKAVNGFLALGGRRQDVYMLSWPDWVDARLVAIQAGDIRWNPLLPAVEAARLADGVPRPRLYLLHPNDRPSLTLLLRWYPTAIMQVYAPADAGGQPYFVTLLVPAGTVAAS